MDGFPQSHQRRDWLDGIELFTRAMNRVFAAIACVLVLVIMSLILVEIFYRYVLHDPIAWVLDITIFLFVFLFFLAVAPALESGSHVEVDLFDPFIPNAARKAQRLIGKALTSIFAVVFFWFVLAFYREIVDADELSFTMITVQLKFIYWIGPVGAFQLLLTAIVLFIRFWREPLACNDDEPARAA